LPLGSQAASNQLWEIPICVKYPAGVKARQCVLMTSKSQILTLSKARSCPGWIYANADEAGYYRVLYEPAALGSLARNEEALTLPERVGLLGNVSALTKGHMPLGEAMLLVPKFADDPSPEVVSKMVAIVGNLDEHLVPDQLKANYRRYLSDLYKKRGEEGWKERPEEPPDTRLLRPQLFELMANRVEDPQFIEQRKKLALVWLNDHAAVDQDMIGAVLNSAAAHGDRALFDRLREQAKTESDEQVQFTMLRAMGQFRDPEIVKSALGLVLGNEFDVRQSVFGILRGAALSRSGRDVTYDFVKRIGTL
jgi:cytosol alanyl aminopeptidase